MTPVLTGIDTLCLSIRVRRFDFTPGEVRYLQQAKSAARAASTRSPGGVACQLRGIRFMMMPRGRAPGLEWVLVNADVTIAIAERPEPEVPASTVEVVIDFRSAYLWHIGHKAAVASTLGWVSTWADVTEVLVSRLDLTVDIAGSPGSIEPSVNVRTRARSRVKYWSFGESTGITVGAGDLMVRIYDKALEIQERSPEKVWFHDLWRDGGWDGVAPVWRTEAQLRRRALDELGVHRPDDLEPENLQGLWEYVTMHWLTLVADYGGANVSRAPLLPYWQCVQGAHFGPHGPRLHRQRRHAVSLDVALRNLRSAQDTYVATAAAHLAPSSRTDDLVPALAEARRSMHRDSYLPVPLERQEAQLAKAATKAEMVQRERGLMVPTVDMLGNVHSTLLERPVEPTPIPRIGPESLVRRDGLPDSPDVPMGAWWLLSEAPDDAEVLDE